MNTDILKELGFTNTEIKIYLALLECGASLASFISKKSKVERAVTYHILEKLMRKGLVGYVIKENRKYFSSAGPERLKDLLKEREDALNTLLPSLVSLQRPHEEHLSIEVFRGNEGFKTVMDDLIRDKKPYFIIGYTGKGPNISKFWYAHWNRRRVKQKIWRYLLINKGKDTMGALRYAYTKIKTLPSGMLQDSKTSIIIYGKDKVLLFLPLQEFAGIRIKNKEIHDSYKGYFDILWKKST